MIGIYKISNNINNKVYIGCSTDISKRFKEHRNYVLSPKQYNKTLYKAFRKYGIENFTFSILEECSKDFLSIREQYYIKLYNSYLDGYNETIGGDIGSFDRNGEKHPNAKLSELDVIDIRTRYKNLERKSEVYLLYQDRIARNGFNKVWQGITWKNIMPEVFTQENKNFHASHTANIGSINGTSKVNEEDVKNIRIRKLKGEDRKKVYQDYKNKLTFGSFEQIWYNQSWRHVIV